MNSTQAKSENQSVAHTPSTKSQMRDLAFLGAPPLIPGEDVAAYEQLLTLVFGELQPADILEAIWAREYVDLQWEIDRYRRVKANLINGAKQEALVNVLRPLFPASFSGESPVRPLASRWIKRDENAVKEVEDILRSADLTHEAIVAEAASIKLNELERLDRMLVTMEARRDNILRELDRHRATRGAQRRRPAEQIEDAAYQEVEEKSAEDKQREQAA